MNITVIGHLCFDVIHSESFRNGKETQSYGGIFFSVAALANLLSAEDKIYPVFGVGKEDYNEFVERLKQYPNVDVSGIYKLDAPTNRVHLTYKNPEERIECSKHISEPIPWKKIRQYLDADMILVNMVSGYDITLETLDTLRMEIREKDIPVYMDVHSLTLGIHDDFTRFHRPVELWRRWLFWLHAVQMNEEEAAILTPEHFDEEILAKQILLLNTKAFILTRGQKGFTAFIDEHKRAKRIDEDAVSKEQGIDATGCGDVFAAAYCVHYLKSRDVVASAHVANQVAGFNATLPGSLEIDKLSKFRSHETALLENAS